MYDPERLAELHAEIRQSIARDPVPGLAWAIVTADSVLDLGGTGWARRESGDSVTAQTLFRAGSISKSLTALGIMKLVADRQLALSDTLYKLIPELSWDNPWRDSDPLQVVHLLEHTTGFDEMHFNEYYDAAGHTPLKQALQRNPGSRTVRWRPGSRTSYSNTGFAMAGYLIERISKMDFETFMRIKILRPLGMHASDFVVRRDSTFQYAEGYFPSGLSIQPYLAYHYRPAIHLLSNAQDLSTFLVFMLRKDEPNQLGIPRHLLHRMESGESAQAARQGLQYGYGAGVQVRFFRGMKMCTHSGSIQGFRSLYQYFPEEGRGYLLLCNGDGKWPASLETAFKRFLFGSMGYVTPESYPVDSALFAAYAGTYKLSNSRNALYRFLDFFSAGITIHHFSDHLGVRSSGGDWIPFYPVDSHLLRLGNQVRPSMLLGSAQDGSPFVQIGNQYFTPISGSLFNSLVISVVVGRALLLSTLLFTLLSIIQLLRRKLPRRLFFNSVWTFVPSLLVLFALQLYASLPDASTGTFNLRTFLIFLFSLAIPLISLWGVVQWFRFHRRYRYQVVRVYLFLVLLCNLGLSVFMGVFGLMGLALWSY